MIVNKKSNLSTNRLLQPKTALLVYLFISIFFFLAVYDFYQGFILIGNPPSLESKRFVAFWITSLIPLGVWLYGLKLARQGSLPGILNEKVVVKASRLPLAVRVGVSIALILLPTLLFLYSSFGNYSFIYWLRLFTIFACGFLSAFLLFHKNLNFFWLLKPAAMVMIATADICSG